MKKTHLSLLSLACSICMAYSQPGNSYTNPVLRGDMADPSIIRVGNTYYATTTSSEWAPFHPMFTSTDMVNWTQTGYVFDKQPEWTSSSFWAPELFYYQNKMFVYYTARNKAGISYIGVASSDDPTQPFTDHGVLVEFEKEAIDPFILEDNGQLYITWKAYGLDDRPIELLCSKLSSDGLHLEGKPFSLMRDDERIGMEGQCWFKKGDYYYMIYSSHSCCGPKSDYQVRVARSKNLRGPYEKYSGNPILHGGGDVLSCGHSTVTTTQDGRLFHLCHAYFAGDKFYAGRQPILQEIIINKDNWIEFTTGDVAQSKQPVPFVNTLQRPQKDFEDTFESDALKLDWAWNYLYSEIWTKTGNGYLELSGTPKGDNVNGTVLCVRPVAPHYSYETQVSNQNKSLKGLTLYGDDKNMVAFGYQGSELILKEVIDGKETVLSQSPASSSASYLKMEITNGIQCSFFWSADGKTWTQITQIPAKRDYSKLVRWDRVPRIGLLHCGENNEAAIFSCFTVKNLL